MNDTYLDAVSTDVGKKVAKKLGLPQPVRLRRTDPASPDAPLVTGPVLVLQDAWSRASADAVAERLLGWDLDVRRDPHLAEHQRWGAVIVVLTELEAPGQLGGPALDLGEMLRRLAPSGRVITLSRAATGGDAPAQAAARQAVDGFLRSVAKELRAGATGNGLVLAEGLPVEATSVIGALRFLLSARSAFVSGQLLRVSTPGGQAPTDWTRPLAGQVAVVTGAARGIGAETARVLARDGAQVIGVDVPGAGDSLSTVMNGVRGSALQLDITAEDAGARILEHARSRYGTLDVVVHNAGILRDKLLVNMTADRWNDLLAVNLLAPLRMNETFAAPGALGPAPRILALASTSGIAGNRGQTNYAAAKAGIIGMVQALAPRLAELGGTANAVAPGFIETDMTARIPPVARQIARRANSLNQGGHPVDVAEALAFLASPQAGGINGQTLRVCGQNLVGQ
ncbi:3-oxoacyl-ACP reductase [Georgenia faecalis]|uniref:3-oxoacyl-ACP reductase n=1 Tax=Georgenia faecalis TaxID=2483799 RepID=UPI000FD71104|nr:3-oxoacyl-ACP reductase [Georgenia faecalis]